MLTKQNCHAGHDLVDKSETPFFCDCGRVGHCGCRNETMESLLSTESDSVRNNPVENNYCTKFRAAIVFHRFWSSHSIISYTLSQVIKQTVMSLIGIRTLFKRLERFGDFKFSSACKKALKENSKTFLFVYADIEEFGVSTKQMSFVSLAEAKALQIKLSNHTSKDRLLHLSRQRFEAAIANQPNNKNLIFSYANIIKQHALREFPEGGIGFDWIDSFPSWIFVRHRSILIEFLWNFLCWSCNFSLW